MSNNKASNLWKKEDWLAVWIGFIVIAVACIAVLTGSFDFSAAKFGTWHWWENVEAKKSWPHNSTASFGLNCSAPSW
ncbi:MAG: hypothetical protein IKH61_04165 [Bacteroidales bacterium]|nr:hypothetical protein [Bacteroidales bacterium]